MATRFPPGSSDSNKSILTATGLKGDQGDPALSVVLQAPSIVIPCDNDDANPVFTEAGSQVYILKAGVVQTGWTLVYGSGVNCTGAVDNASEPREVGITAITDDTGYAVFTATKSGEVTQNFRFYFARGKAGVQGATGSTGSAGSTGATGAAGPAGGDGTGLVIAHKTITVEAGETVTKQDYGDGALQLNYSGAHGLSVGDFVWVFQSGVYDNGYGVVEVVDSDSVKLLATYDATGGTVTAFGTDNFRALNDAVNQVIQFVDIIPYGAKVLEWQLLYSDDNSGTIDPVTVDIGDVAAITLDSITPNWLNGAYLSNEGEVVARDRRSVVPMLTSSYDTIYLDITPTAGNLWDGVLATFELEFFLAYINYDPTYTP